mmetsp:Transcript_9678/g.24655  ORF Transcript_9678/g.24655 Transcript_9678/m.24655 type:complete len:272 (+) Transcript_9678:1043-1858(+)
MAPWMPSGSISRMEPKALRMLCGKQAGVAPAIFIVMCRGRASSKRLHVRWARAWYSDGNAARVRDAAKGKRTCRSLWSTSCAVSHLSSVAAKRESGCRPMSRLAEPWVRPASRVLWALALGCPLAGRGGSPSAERGRGGRRLGMLCLVCGPALPPRGGSDSIVIGMLNGPGMLSVAWMVHAGMMDAGSCATISSISDGSSSSGSMSSLSSSSRRNFAESSSMGSPSEAGAGSDGEATDSDGALEVTAGSASASAPALALDRLLGVAGSAPG